MANELYERLNESQLVARTVILEYKTIKFDNKQKSTTFQSCIFEKKDIIKASVELLKLIWPL
jgi:nucleotidyltransferase/DNA polymerase involved in DNA repair